MHFVVFAPYIFISFKLQWIIEAKTHHRSWDIGCAIANTKTLYLWRLWPHFGDFQQIPIPLFHLSAIQSHLPNVSFAGHRKYRFMGRRQIWLARHRAVQLVLCLPSENSPKSLLLFWSQCKSSKIYATLG